VSPGLGAQKYNPELLWNGKPTDSRIIQLSDRLRQVRRVRNIFFYSLTHSVCSELLRPAGEKLKTPGVRIYLRASSLVSFLEVISANFKSWPRLNNSNQSHDFMPTGSESDFCSLALFELFFGADNTCSLN
jgi:hypothetical protein